MSAKVINLAERRRREASTIDGSATTPSDRRGGDMREVVTGILENITSSEDDDSVGSRMLLCRKIAQQLNGWNLQDNDRRLKEYKSVVDSYSTDTIFNFLLKATPHQLSTKPYFYKALLNAARSRLLQTEDPETE